MKFTLLFLAVAIVCVVNADDNEVNEKERFNKFAAKHGKKYKDDAEKEKAMKNLNANCDAADEQNKLHAEGKSTHTASCDHGFSDEPAEETVAKRCNTKAPSKSSSFGDFPLDISNQTRLGAPLAVDWTSFCRPVPDQIGCGAGWAFATQAQLECKLKMQNPGATIPSFSAQYLIDCATVGNYGCFGGWPYYAMSYIWWFGTPTTATYPYTGVQSYCNSAPFKITSPLRIVSQVYLGGIEWILREYVSFYGPMVVVINATPKFNAYASGILDDTTCRNDCTNLNHAMVVVGYGVDPNGVAYWKVRNSYGPNWGEGGYVRMIANKNSCGISCWAMAQLP